jgi:hypothetical protein
MEEMKGRKKRTFNLMVQGDDIILATLSNLNQTISQNKIKNPKSCYKLNPKHVPLKKKVSTPTTKPYT